LHYIELIYQSVFCRKISILQRRASARLRETSKKARLEAPSPSYQPAESDSEEDPCFTISFYLKLKTFRTCIEPTGVPFALTSKK